MTVISARRFPIPQQMAKYQIRTGMPEIKCDCVRICKKERLVAWHFALSQVAARGEDWTDKRKQIGSKQGRWWASAWVKHWTELGPSFFLTHCITHFIPAAVLVIYIGTEMSHKLFHINNRVTTTRGLCMQMLGGVYSGDWRCCSALLCSALICSHVGRYNSPLAQAAAAVPGWLRD